MTSLRDLNLRETPVSDLTPLQGLKLKILAMVDSRVSDVSPLRGMALEKVSLTPTNVAKGLDVLRGMESLKTIGVGFAKTEIFPAAEFWERYDKGEFDPDRRAAEYVLSIGGTVRVEGDHREIKAVAELPHGALRLTLVGLQNNGQVADAGLAALKDCKNLEIIYLFFDRQVTDAGLAHLKDCKTITQLHLQGTAVTDAGLACFKDSKIIAALYVSGSQITDTGLAHFKNCLDMTHLYLGHTEVTDMGLVQVKAYRI